MASTVDLYAEYAALRQQGLGKRKAAGVVAKKNGLALDSVRRRMNEYEKRIPKAEAPRPFTVLPKRAQTVDDVDRWRDTLATLARREQYVKVAHLCDIHFPDHSEDALNLAYRLIARRQPHVIVVGSDTADFSVISRFKPNPDHDEQIDDELDEFRRYWIPHIDTLRSIAPRAALIHIAGNHEERIYNHISENAPKLRKTIERAWIDAITYQGRVMWVGRVQEVDIGNLLVKHGDKTNEHVAKSLLEQQSYQVSVMAGHVHRMTAYNRRGRRYAVSAITSGCLCNLIPQYAVSNKSSSYWQHGTAIATVDLRGTDVWFDNVAFRNVNGSMVAVSDGEVITQTVAADDAAGRAA